VATTTLQVGPGAVPRPLRRAASGAPSMRDVPLLVLIATIWAYWLGIVAMMIRVRRRSGRLVGLVPEQRRERYMWIIWVPLVILWLLLPYWAATRSTAPYVVPEFAHANAAYAPLRWIAALGAVLALALTVKCWLRMGDDWRMDVGERTTRLITDGLFARIRHPIYALSMLLMLCTLAIVPTWPMLLVWGTHLVLNHLKARNEESHLARVHGESYARYMERTGRFVPRVSVRGD
jgi:protein-S-isoprenylcysteine O-methyltransferase Ste14